MDLRQFFNRSTEKESRDAIISTAIAQLFLCKKELIKEIGKEEYTRIKKIVISAFQ